MTAPSEPRAVPPAAGAGIDGAESEAVVETMAAPVPADVSVNVLAGGSLVPLTLPADAPLTRLVDPVVAQVNKRLAGQGGGRLADRVRYEFAWTDKTLLSEKPAATLATSGVRRGDILRLVPVGEALRYVARNENPASGLAAYLRGVLKPVDPSTARAVAVGAVVVAALTVTALVWRARLQLQYGWVAAGALAAVAAVMGLCALVTARRWPELSRVRDVFAATSVVVASAALAALPPKIGVPNVFAALVALTALSVVLVGRTRRYWAAGAAITTVTGLGAIAALVGLYSPLHDYQLGASALVAVVVLVVRVPAFGLVLSRIPRQPFRSVRNRDMYARAEGQPHDSVSPVEDETPDPTVLSTAQTSAAGDRSRSVLVGISIAAAFLQVVGAWLTVIPHAHYPVWTIIFVCDVALFVIIAARRFYDRVQAVLLVSSSVVALISIGAKYAWCTPGQDIYAVLLYAGLACVPAVIVFAIGTAGWQHLASPNTRKAVEWLGYVLLVGGVLLFGVVLDIFSFFRTQGFGW
ncbi:type VII secretion integral membrane protein EccD [Mycobacteroides salmoniphilum]|uniref:type VII secretion integral membrane protein EccD n=1 Tax=Mycobacteroides salmoniphilum TaxID=404941 RepID=UPI003563EA9A